MFSFPARRMQQPGAERAGLAANDTQLCKRKTSENQNFQIKLVEERFALELAMAIITARSRFEELGSCLLGPRGNWRHTKICRRN